MPVFPFSAIVGQDGLKTALLIAAIEPLIGGVLAFGDRGTGKTTAIRALAALLPPIDTVADCPYRCAPPNPAGLCELCRGARKTDPLTATKEAPPVINLPLGATEDRVIGSVDLERALIDGKMTFEPGLLAAAHRGFLYVDEVNLLDDHLVDILLDVAASGINRVEREGLSITHPSDFVLIGSGNPEEGELRPQLLDRFGLSVDVRTPKSVADRVEVIRRRDAFERDREGFAKSWRRKDLAVRRKVEQAKAALPDVILDDETLGQAAALCLELGSDGLRGELALMRAARALAALDGKETVTAAHLRRAAPFALGHRLRKDPLDESDATSRVARVVEEILPL
ncbi:MAG: magnesium chelatase ATPase subunit I [Pseudomonadota bacterium]